MKTCSHLWQYIADLFLKWEIFQIKVVDKTKTHILCSVTCFRKSCRLWDNVEKYGGARGATNDIIIWLIRFAYWISKATRIHTPKHSGICMDWCDHTHTDICNICCFPMQTRLNDTLCNNYIYIIFITWFVRSNVNCM